MTTVRFRLVVLLGLALTPVACADLLGLEPGVLGSGLGGAAGSDVNDAGTAGKASAGGDATVAGSGANGGSSVIGGADNGGESSGGGTSAGESTGGVGGDGDGTTPDGGEPNNGPCNNGTCTVCPSDMQRVITAVSDFYCIDSAEVTNQQYLAFTKRYTVDTVIATTECEANASLVPDESCGGALTDVPSRDLPVVCVDFCDAQAYCMMRGRRLCGRVGGVMNNPGDDANATASEWYAACTGPNEYVYPYGDAASATACNGSGYAPSDMGPRDVETLASCQGGVHGVYNMSGNVSEWEWSCTSSKANAICSTRGGGFRDGPYELRCTGSIGVNRLDASDSLGFRCCADLR